MQFFFHSYVKPYRFVISKETAHWIKNILEMTGMDVEVLSAHSVKEALTSAAVNRNLDVMYACRRCVNTVHKSVS